MEIEVYFLSTKGNSIAEYVKCVYLGLQLKNTFNGITGIIEITNDQKCIKKHILKEFKKT